MNDQFIPMNQTAGVGSEPAPAPAATPINPDTLAQNELIKITQDSRVLQILKYSAHLQQLLHVTSIQTQTEYDQVIDAFDSAKKLLKAIDAREEEMLGFPVRVVKLGKGLFKQLRDNVKIMKDHYGSLIDAKKKFDEGQYERTAAAAESVPAEPQTQQGDDGVGTVTFDAQTPAPPNNVVTSAKGAKVHTRTGIELEVVDIIAFLKLVISKNKRNAAFNEAAAELVTVNFGPLKRIIKEGNRRSVAGIKITETSKTV